MEDNLTNAPSPSFYERRSQRSPLPSGNDRRFSITPESIGLDQPQKPVYDHFKFAMPIDDNTFPERPPEVITDMHIDTRDRYGEWQVSARDPQEYERQSRRVFINPVPQISNERCTATPATTTTRKLNASSCSKESFTDILASAFLSGLEYTLTCFVPGIYSTVPNLKSPTKNFPLSRKPCCVQTPNDDPTNATTMDEIPTEYYEKHLQQYWNCDMFLSDSAKIVGQVNEMFLARLKDIDVRGKGNKYLKLITYQKWVDVLLKVNISLLINMEELESELFERFECLCRIMNINRRYSESDELLKSRRDINSLIKIIQNAYHNKRWDFQGVSFETISLEDVLGANNTNGQNRRDEDAAPDKEKQSNDVELEQKFRCHINVLAVEVAEKYDEIRELRKKFASLEDEMQEILENVHVKEGLIKKLCSDINCANEKLITQDCVKNYEALRSSILKSQPFICSYVASVSNCHDNTNNNSSIQFDCLTPSQNEEQEKLKLLRNELNEFFAMNKERNKQNLEMHCQRFASIIQNLEREKLEAFRMLDYIQNKLVGLASFGIDTQLKNRNTNDKDMKITSP